MTKQAKHIMTYPPEFRAEAIRLARTSGKPHAQIAQDLGMTGETLRIWLKQAARVKLIAARSLVSCRQVQKTMLANEDLLKGIRGILHEVKPVGDLQSCRCSRA